MSWQERAACGRISQRAADRLFFGNASPDIAAAKRICRTCPVLEHCRALADACETNPSTAYLVGIFGGESVTERRQRRRQTQAGGRA